MQQSILHVSLLVRDYDEAIAFYVNKLNFTLIEDSCLGADKRWVVVAPPASDRKTSTMSLVLAKAQTADEKNQLGCQSGGRVFLFLCTDNFYRDYEQMRSGGIKFIREPETFDYGTVAVFSDLYGNLWDLLQPSPEHAMFAEMSNRNLL